MWTASTATQQPRPSQKLELTVEIWKKRVRCFNRARLRHCYLLLSVTSLSSFDLNLCPNILREFHVHGWTLLGSKPTQMTTMILRLLLYYKINFVSFEVIKQNIMNPSVLLLRYAYVSIVFLLLLSNSSLWTTVISDILYTVTITW
jgi:hypothetical protein